MKQLFHVLFFFIFATASSSGQSSTEITVPLKYRTGINIFTPQKGKAATIEDTVSIGELGDNYLVLHGRRHPLIYAKVEDTEDFDLINLSTKPDSEGGWVISIMGIKKRDDLNNKRYFITLEYTHRDSSLQNKAVTYCILMGPPRE